MRILRLSSDNVSQNKVIEERVRHKVIYDVMQ